MPGNILTIQAAALSLPGGITPNIQSVLLVYRYTPDGQFIERWEGHPIATTSRIVALRVDSQDRVYAAGVTNNETALLQRLSDPVGVNWSNALSDVRLEVTSLAFDPDDNPVLLGTDNVGIRVIKVDRERRPIPGHPLRVRPLTGHSCRSAIIGSTRVARRAGCAIASKAAVTINATLATKVSGSACVTP